MKRSELIRLSTLAEEIGCNAPAPAELSSMLIRAGIKSGNFYREIEMDSPLTEVWRGCDPFSDMETVHSHSFYEIICCTAGNVQYLLGPACRQVSEGDVLVIPPGVSHRRMPSTSEEAHAPYARYGMWVNASHFAQLARFFPELNLPRSTPYILYAEYAEAYSLKGHLIRAWAEVEQGTPLHNAAVYGESILFLTNLCRAIQSSSSENTLSSFHPKDDLLDQILTYIDANLGERITLADIEENFFVSKSYISHQFQSKLGSSFYQYVTQKRLILAKSLIEDGTAMEQAGRLVGFSGYSNFYRAFKKEYGIAPSEYRAIFQRDGKVSGDSKTGLL